MPKLKDKRFALLQDAKAITEVAISEGRNLSDEEKAKVVNLMDEAKRLKDDIALIDRVATELEAKAADGEAQAKKQAKGSIGEQFVQDEQFQGWLKQIAPSGRIPDSMKGIHSPSIDVKGLNLKTLVTGSGATSGGAFIVAEDTGIYEPLGRYPTSVLDLVARRVTGTDAVEFVRQTAQVTQAAAVEEATSTASGGDKPEGAMAYERVTVNVETIPVWVPATKRALSDASQLRGIIDQEIRDDLREEVNRLILNGDGADGEFTGIYNTTNVLGQAYSTDILTTTRKAITNLRTNGKVNPTGWVMHPNDWESIDLLKDGENRFYRGGPFMGGPQTLWGVPVVEDFAAVEGTPILGNWNKAVLWDREQTTISISDSHDDFFIRNMIAILGELRAAFGVLKPSAFVEVSLSAS
jgi:HK97 family phage major capsid protein